MKFSELWLREWINLPVDSATLVDNITMFGLKVNMVEPVLAHFNGVRIGKIISIKVHPQDCNLLINTVDIGDNHSFNIISESKKCKKNLRVAVAPVGAKLSGNLQVKSTSKLGELSEGILCSFSSLGIICNDINDIIELPRDAPIGLDLRRYLHFDDNIIDFSITPNRGDCLNLMGIARDIAAIYRLPITIPEIDYVIPLIDDMLKVSVNIPNACPCYFSRILKNVDLSVPTPIWMKERLRRSGMQSVNVAIDVTNYVLLEFGQPIHIFDLDTIVGDITIRFAKKGESLCLPFTKNHILLNEDTIIISDKIQPLGISGLLVGNISMINTVTTSNIFLESAFFNSYYIIKSAKQYGIISSSFYRYERQGVNPNISRLALERVTYFLINICGGLPGRVISVIYKDLLPKNIVIVLRRFKLDKLLGCVINDNEVFDILSYLGCKVQQESDNNSWIVSVPVWRFDIKIEEDLIEEIVRLYGYDKLTGLPVYSKLNILQQSKNKLSLSRIKTLLIDLGYQEIITYSFVDPEIQSLLYPNSNFVTLLNPLTLDMSVMRSSLLIGLLKTLLYNQNRQQKRIRLFEFGTCFMPDIKNATKICQYYMLSGIIFGSKCDEHWDILSNVVDFYDIKGDVEVLLETTGKLNNIKFKPQICVKALHPGQSANIFLNREHIGFAGLIHPIIEKKLNLKAHTFVFELFWDKVFQNIKLSKIINIPKFPINRRDISIIVNENIASGDVLSECKKIIKDKLIDIKLFDVYRGVRISKGFKSLSIALYIHDCFHTLREKEIELIVKKCIFALQNRFQISLRKK